MTPASTLLRPAPNAYPVVGDLPRFLRDRLGFLRECDEALDDATAVVSLRLGTTAYLLLDAQDIKHVLETNASNYEKTSRLTSPRGRWLSGHGVLTATGSGHLPKRRALQPAYSAKAVAALADTIVREVDSTLADWEDRETIDAGQAMMDLAQQVNGRLLFSADYRGADAPLAHAIRVRRRFMQEFFDSVALAGYWPTVTRFKYRSAQKLIDREIERRIAERRSEPEKNQDMLGSMMALLDEPSAHQEAMTAAITGYETIGEALAWTTLLLAQHPDVQHKLLEEVDALNGELPTHGALPRLAYTDQVLSESMRLFPPTWIYVRMAQGADRLPSGVVVPAGMKLYICPWVIHRSQRYFDAPREFDPERFGAGTAPRPRYAYFPFGGGPRICIGQSLAKLQLVLTLAVFVQRFRWELLPGQTIEPKPGITLHPYPGILIRLCRRSSKESDSHPTAKAAVE